MLAPWLKVAFSYRVAVKWYVGHFLRTYGVRFSYCFNMRTEPRISLRSRICLAFRRQFPSTEILVPPIVGKQHENLFLILQTRMIKFRYLIICVSCGPQMRQSSPSHEVYGNTMADGSVQDLGRCGGSPP